MVNLFINFYIDQRNDRQQELLFCLQDNIGNGLIDNIFILGDPSNIPYGTIGKIRIIPFTARPTYSDFFEVINNNSLVLDINIISNSDIFFDETLKLLSNIKENECYALSRWNMNPNGSITLFERRDSQDVWVFRGHVPDSIPGNFSLGKPGCDNRIAHEIQSANYRIYNPCLSIRTIHFHNTEVRNFDWNNEAEKVQPPYLLLDPAYL